MAKTTVIYLLHFERPFGHARHYIGSSICLEARLAKHGTADGAKLLYWVRQAGITWTLVRTWPGGRMEEKRLKAQGGASRLCPACKASRNVPAPVGSSEIEEESSPHVHPHFGAR